MRPEIFGTRDTRLRVDIRRLCRQVARDFRPGACVVNIVFVGDPKIQTLNHRFLDRDRPTDVISFNSEQPRLRGEPCLLGEVYVSRDRARAQAREYGATYASELRRLVLHGLLHLLGLDHGEMEPLYSRYLKS
jgi:probable rRNA maturation factor